MHPSAALTRLAAPHLYRGERLIWAAEQRRPRELTRRLLSALPAVVALAVGARELGRVIEAPTPASLSALLVLCAASCLYLFVTLVRPSLRARQVTALHAILSDRRLLFLETHRDGSHRIRHPTGPAMLEAGDVSSARLRARRHSNDVALRHTPALEGRVTHLEVSDEELDELLAGLRSTLELRLRHLPPAWRRMRS